jgi:hypothetical protein
MIPYGVATQQNISPHKSDNLMNERERILPETMRIRLLSVPSSAMFFIDRTKLLMEPGNEVWSVSRRSHDNYYVALGGLVVSVLATGPKVAG